MEADIYTALAEAVRSAGGADSIGVVSEPGETAVSYAGTEILRQYMDGTVHMAAVFGISGMDTDQRQKELIERLCAVGERIAAGNITVEGLDNIRCRVVSPPTATVHNEHLWIYMTQVRATFMYKKG